MAQQELDLCLHYRPERVNENVDAISHGPVQTQPTVITDDPECVVAIITDPQSANKDGEEDMTHDIKCAARLATNLQPTDNDGEEDMTLAERQSSDAKLRPIIQYLIIREGILPDDKKSAKDLALNKKQYVLMGSVLYHRYKNHKVQSPEPDKRQVQMA